jgi:hypothetical protein
MQDEGFPFVTSNAVELVVAAEPEQFTAEKYCDPFKGR